MKTLVAVVLAGWCAAAFAAEVIPPPPARYFNDYANVVSPATAARLNQTLEDFERQSSCQILVAIFPKMQSDSSLEDYTVRVAQSWRVGQKAKDNGAVLFVFVQEHRVRIEVGYGLEGSLPDALAKRIIDEQITPRFRAGDFDGGLTAGVQSMIAATKGEYKGSGRTVAERHFSGEWSSGLVFFFFIALFIAVIIIRAMSLANASSWLITSALSSGLSGRRDSGNSGWFGGGGWGGGGGGFSGGGFSGGGGSFGGGGASGSW